MKVAAIHGSTPFSLMFGRQFNLFWNHHQTLSKPLPNPYLQKRIDYLTMIVFPSISTHTKTNQNKMINRFNNKMHTEDILFLDGSYVMVIDVVRRSKLDPRYEGPFKVIRRTRGGSYVLQDNDGTLLPHNYPPSALKLISQDPIFSGQSYEVEAILDHKDKGPDRYYLVKWKNFDKSHNSWEPVTNFNDHAVIDKYWKRRDGIRK
jgi:Chromo (CHRromatin Organisation MOdifier) domain